MNRVTLSCTALLFAVFTASAETKSDFDVFANLDTGPGNVTATQAGVSS
ncbi:hypothetical protein [Methylomonas sp. HYX-M1]